MKCVSGIVLALLMSTASLTLAHSAAQTTDGSTSAKKPPAATITRKGVIKSIDDTSVSLAPDDNKKATISFQLTPSVKRSGTLAAGEKAAVTYYEEEARNVVVELKGAKK
jgi:hypothetical protein